MTGVRVCLKELHGTKYDPLSISYTVLSGRDKKMSGTAAWLAQLVERQSAVREVEGSSPRPDQHSGS